MASRSSIFEVTGRQEVMLENQAPDHDTRFELRLAEMARRERDHDARRWLWLSHHWPEQYGERCVRVGSRHVCRRCLSLYPLGVAVALLSASGLPPWPDTFDPAAIWLLSLPATVAFVGEAIGLFGYTRRWQMAAMLVTALGFGRALGYELVDRWSSEFWGPVAVFGGIWFLASAFSAATTPKVNRASLRAATLGPAPEVEIEVEVEVD